MNEEHNKDTGVFAYSTTRVALVVFFGQSIGFVFHPREGVDAPPITLVDEIPPNIRGLEKYFTLRNPRWTDQHSKGVNRRREGVETKAPTPSKRNSGSNVNNDAGFLDLY